MAGSPVWKVYRGTEYVAACKYPEDAAALVAVLGDGSTIKHSHGKSLWLEGAETQPAGESYDHVAETVRRRLSGGA